MAFIDEETIKKIRSENDIVDVIGSYLPLVQKGKNYFAVCPFHDDHSPSMSISKDKQIYRCFVCGASGNVISFVRDYEKVSFQEALEILGKNVGIKINSEKKSNYSPYKEFYDIYNISKDYYKNNLNSKSGEKAREYLNKRKLDKSTLDYFDIGLSLNGGLANSLAKKHDKNKLIDIGLCNSELKDLFHNRIMFTIKDNDGNTVAFSGRKYEENNNEPKYINSKETVIFKKGTILYNLYNAKDYIRKKKEIIISEGFMEVIRLHTIGIDNSVALMGTSFTKEHLNIIKNLKCSVVLNLDQDEAGKTATISIGDTLVENGINPTVIIFSKYKDADELISNEGAEPFLKAYESRVSFIDFKLNYLKKNKDLTNAVDLSKYIKDSTDAINLIDDDILREIKIKELSKNYDLDEDIIRGKITNKNIKEVKQEVIKPKKKIKYNKYDVSEIRLLYLMMNNPELILYYENNLGYMNNTDRRMLANEIVKFKNKNKTFDLGDFICYTMQSQELEKVYKEVMEYNNIDNYSMEEVEDYITRIKEQRVNKQIESLKEKMKNTIDIEEKKRLANKIENIKKEVLKW